MKRHRFDPLSFTFGLLFAFVALFVLLGNSLADLAPAGLWTLPAMTIGLLIVLYGVRRLLPSTASGTSETPEDGKEDAGPSYLDDAE